MDKFKYETHLHTCETSPCGKVPAEQAVRIYHRAGYAGIAITDHYYRGFFEKRRFTGWSKKVDLFLEGYKKARQEGQKLGLDIFLGMEIRFDENVNDYLIYGIDEDFLKRHKALYALTLQEFRNLTYDKGIVVFQAHPFRPYMTSAPLSLIDGVETWNGNPRHDSSNHLARQYAVENGLKMLSGSDFHQVQDAARGGITTEEKIFPDEFPWAIMQDDSIGYIEHDPV